MQNGDGVSSPELWIVAGPNGAGKTTCVQSEPISGILPNVTFLNPDDRTLTELKRLGYSGFADAPADVQTKAFVESADGVLRDLLVELRAAKAMGIETVLSSGKYQSIVEWVIARGGFVGLIYVALSSPKIALERVAARVRRGGHDVPADKIVTRWHRSLDCLAWFALRTSAFWIVDNSSSNPADPPRLVAQGRAGKIVQLATDAFPELIAALASVPRSMCPDE